MTKKHTRILGISAYYHDSAACLVEDGKIVAAAQEERFTRNKHDPRFPTEAIKSCLDEGNCQLEQLDAVIFYDKPLLKFERLLETYLASAPRGFSSFLKAMPVWLKEKLYLKSVLRRELRALVHQQRALQQGTDIAEQRRLDKKPELPKLLFSEHHQSHAASAYFPSPFDEALVLCLDGVGEWTTSSAWHGKGAELKPLWEIQFPHSLGLLYSAFTYYCGFRVNSGEYKLMGLAPYGEPKYVDIITDNLVDIREDGSFSLNMDYFDYAVGNAMTNERFHRLFDGPPHPADAEVTQKQMDLARSIQVVTEELVLRIARHAHQQTGCKYLCLAGGVALNCVANGRLLREGPFEDIWIQPAAGDAGGALGAALLAWYQYFDNARQTNGNDSMQGALLGPAYDDIRIEAMLQQRQVPYQMAQADALCAQVAELIEQGNVVGWFQGRMEFGPRALGNRSILGDPRNQQMQTQMNLKIKQRESFRPFAPVVKLDCSQQFFELDRPSPYMLLVADVQPAQRINHNDTDAVGLEKLKQARSSVPAITHVDYSARVQTVAEQPNPLFYQLLTAFEQRTGMPMLINTSFNVRGEPPVCSPEDALRCFLATDMDYLVMGNAILNKTEQRKDDIALARQVTFAPD